MQFLGAERIDAGFNPGPQCRAESRDRVSPLFLDLFFDGSPAVV